MSAVLPFLEELPEARSALMPPSTRVWVLGQDAYIQVRGEFDITGTPLLAAALDGAYDMTDVNVVLDVSRLTFADASALRVIAGSNDRLEQAGRHMLIINATPWIRRVFRVVSMEHLLRPWNVDGSETWPLQRVR